MNHFQSIKLIDQPTDWPSGCLVNWLMNELPLGLPAFWPAYLHIFLYYLSSQSFIYSVILSCVSSLVHWLTDSLNSSKLTHVGVPIAAVCVPVCMINWLILSHIAKHVMWLANYAIQFMQMSKCSALYSGNTKRHLLTFAWTRTSLAKMKPICSYSVTI